MERYRRVAGDPVQHFDPVKISHKAKHSDSRSGKSEVFGGTPSSPGSAIQKDQRQGKQNQI